MNVERALELLALSLAGEAGEQALRAGATKKEYDVARCLGHIARLSRVLMKKHRQIDENRQAERMAELQVTAGKLASLVGFTPAQQILKKIGVEV